MVPLQRPSRPSRLPKATRAVCEPPLSVRRVRARRADDALASQIAVSEFSWSSNF